MLPGMRCLCRVRFASTTCVGLKALPTRQRGVPRLLGQSSTLASLLHRVQLPSARAVAHAAPKLRIGPTTLIAPAAGPNAAAEPKHRRSQSPMHSDKETWGIWQTPELRSLRHHIGRAGASRWSCAPPLHLMLG
jgi:hypothetical protein